jgi:hypothetical protein
MRFKNKNNERNQGSKVTWSSSGASRLLVLVIMFGDCGSGASWHPYPCAPESI